MDEWLENKTPMSALDRVVPIVLVVAVNAHGEILGFSSMCGAEIKLNYVLAEALHQGSGKAMLQALEARVDRWN